MNSEQNSPQEMMEQPVEIETGSARSFEDSHHSDATSQAGSPALPLSHDVNTRNVGPEKIRYLNAKLEELQETLRYHEELLTRIHKLSGLLDGQQMQLEEHLHMETNADDVNETGSVSYSNTSTPNRPQMVNAISSTQQISSPPAEINAEGDTEDQPTGIQLAEETSHSNSSAEARGLQISSHSEETPETATESITITPPPATPIHHENFLKKRWLAAASSSSNNLEQESPAKKHCGENNSDPSTPSMQNANSSNNNTPTAKRADFSPLLAADHYLENAMVPIGPNGTCIPARVYHNINWKSVSKATRVLLVTIFGRKTLASHSMTGKPSPAFKGRRPVKAALNPEMIADILHAVMRNCNAPESIVRNAITSKCADESKIRRGKENKSMLEINKENQFE